MHRVGRLHCAVLVVARRPGARVRRYGGGLTIPVRSNYCTSMPAIEPHLQRLPAPSHEAQEVRPAEYEHPGLKVTSYPRLYPPMLRVYVRGAWYRGVVRARFTLPAGYAYLTEISPDGMDVITRMYRWDGESVRALRQPAPPTAPAADPAPRRTAGGRTPARRTRGRSAEPSRQPTRAVDGTPGSGQAAAPRR